MKGIPRPRVPEDPPVEPFKKEEIELLIKPCDFCEEAVTDRRRKFIMQSLNQAVHARMAISNHSTARCEMNYSTARSFTL